MPKPQRFQRIISERLQRFALPSGESARVAKAKCYDNCLIYAKKNLQIGQKAFTFIAVCAGWNSYPGVQVMLDSSDEFGLANRSVLSPGRRSREE
ncbi:MAG: hypothetical protein D6814_08785 [Calditrichaeota bacterium]|nr:MAG: hypothetical protein D6814_08785 [Calditrichota bacterium]